MEHISKELWQHQVGFVEAAREIYGDGNGVLFHGGMGVGKTMATCAIMPPRQDYKHLIICPKVMLHTWKREIENCVDGDFDVVVLDSSSVELKAKKLKEAIELAAAKKQALYVITNYESAWRMPLYAQVMGNNWTTIVADECHRIKAPGSKQSKFMARLADRGVFRVGLSGTPFPQGPLDAYGIYRFLNKGIFGKSFYPFRNRFALMGGFGGKQVVGYQNVDELSAKINSIKYYAGRDLLDLPEAVHKQIVLPVPHKMGKQYRMLEKEMYTWIKEAGAEVTVSNALVKLLRLQQMTSGYVKGDDDKLVELHTAKQDATEEILEDIAPDEKVVIFCRFTHDVQAAKEAAANVGRPAYEISGARNELGTWQDDPPSEGAVIAVQIDSGSEGISLVQARHCIMWSVGFSLAKYLQALARTHRPGQTDTCFYHHLVMEGTVDEKVYKALAQKQQVIETIIGEVQ